MSRPRCMSKIYTRCLLMLLSCALFVIPSLGVASASDEFLWYKPAQMTFSQMNEMEEVGRALQKKIHELLILYEKQLSPADYFYYHCLYDHMADLHIDDDWEDFYKALVDSENADQFASILDEPFLGITTAHEGYLPQDQLSTIVKDILVSAKSDLLFDRMITLPKTCYDEYGEAWSVWLISPDDVQHGNMRFTRDGRLMSYSHYTIPSEYID